MEAIAITNAQELQAEIQRLRAVQAEQKTALGLRFSSPAAIFASARSLFPKKEGSAAGGLLHPDIVNLVSRFAIPFTLNKTVFRHSNFLVKALVGLASQKAAGLVNEKSAESLLTKGKALFNQIIHKEKHAPEQARVEPNHNQPGQILKSHE